MQQNYEACRQIILNNTKEDLSREAIELLTAAAFAISLESKPLVDAYLPIILKNTTILTGNETIQDIFKTNFPLEECVFDETASASFFRVFELDEGSEKVEYKSYFLLSTKGTDPVEAVVRTCVEVLHMLRIGTPEVHNGKIRSVNGLTVDSINPETKEIKRKNVALEVAAVQLYADELMHSLDSALNTKDCFGSQVLKRFKRKIDSYAYDVNVKEKRIIRLLCAYPAFAEALDRSFTAEENPSEFSVKFNEVLNSSTSFSRFSKIVDRIHSNEATQEDYQKIAEMLSIIQVKAAKQRLA